MTNATAQLNNAIALVPHTLSTQVIAGIAIAVFVIIIIAVAFSLLNK